MKKHIKTILWVIIILQLLFLLFRGVEIYQEKFQKLPMVAPEGVI